jgi:hypothetical protein
MMRVFLVLFVVIIAANIAIGNGEYVLRTSARSAVLVGVRALYLWRYWLVVLTTPQSGDFRRKYSAKR